LHIF
jgi:polyribonucleotide 5'-hydroxyl-kinase